MMQSMKIAVCFFGITRKLKEHTLASIEECLLRPVADLDPAYKKFGHFNLVGHVSNPRTGEADIPVDAGEFKLLNCDAVATTDQPALDAGMDSKPFEAFGDGWEDNFSSLKNLLRQFHSLNQVTELLLRSGQHFDAVIYTRADLRFERRTELPKPRAATLYTPWFGRGGGLNDRFALGDLTTMVKYGRRGAMARQYCEATGKPLHAERFLLWYAKTHHLRIRNLTSIDFSRVRANGTVPAWDIIVKTRFKYRLRRAVSRLRNLAMG